jgi:hypothetical protein
MGEIRSRTLKDRQYNDQKKKDKRTDNDLQNTTQKTKGRTTWTPLKTGVELRCSGRVICVLVISHFYGKFVQEKFEDINGEIRSRTLKKDRQYNDQKRKDKQWSIKYYTKN